jgi:serine/threonine-protein kinase
VLHGELTGNAQVVKRFLREGRAASAIVHPAIVEVLDVGVTDVGDPYIVMEYLEGESLAQLMERNSELDPLAVYGIVAEVLAGLQAAHEAGVVHRDLKPENVFLVRRDDDHVVVKIIDFGVAKLLQEDGSGHITETGQVLGTPAFLSPEQARGQSDLDARSDIYAVGVLMFKMLTGHLPYRASSRNELIAELITGNAQRFDELSEELPEQVRPLVVRALRPDRDERMPSAAAMLEGLEQLPGFDDRQSALLAISRGAFERTIPAGDLGRPLSTSPPRSADSVLAELMTETLDPASFETTPAPRTSRRWFAGLAAFVVLGTGGWAYSITRGPTPSRLEGTMVPAVRWPEASHGARVALTLRGLPGEAKVSFGGVIYEANPLQVPRSHETTALRVTAPGFEPTVVRIIADHDQVIALAPTPIASAAADQVETKGSAPQRPEIRRSPPKSGFRSEFE